MDESRLPWWLVVLLAVWVAGLSVWQSSRLKLEFRIRAGALSLLYLALLVIALCGGRRGVADAAVTGGWRAADVVISVTSLVALIAAVMIVGRPTRRGGLVWFALLTLANAVTSSAAGANVAAGGLGLLAVASLLIFATEIRHVGPFSLHELLPEPDSLPNTETRFTSWLVGAAGLVLSVVLVGTVDYSLRAETQRATASRRHSALPSAARVRSALASGAETDRSSSLLELATGRRADVVILLAVLTFLAFASTMSSTHNFSEQPVGESTT